MPSPKRKFRWVRRYDTPEGGFIEPDLNSDGGSSFGIYFGGFLWFWTLYALLAAVTLPVTRTLLARTWVATTCEIESASVEHAYTRVRGHLEDTSRVRVKYRYFVNGLPHSSVRLDFIDGALGSDGQSKAAELAAGSRVPCFYDPSDPAEAVLERRGFPNPLFVFLIEMIGSVGVFLYRDTLYNLERVRPRPVYRAVQVLASITTVCSLLVGIGLCIFAGAPVWAWLVFSVLPLGLTVFCNLDA